MRTISSSLRVIRILTKDGLDYLTGLAIVYNSLEELDRTAPDGLCLNCTFAESIASLDCTRKILASVIVSKK